MRFSEKMFVNHNMLKKRYIPCFFNGICFGVPDPVPFPVCCIANKHTRPGSRGYFVSGRVDMYCDWAAKNPQM